MWRAKAAMFRLMKLRPPHGWPPVWWELGIVTLGVLIALAAQQMVEAVNNRRVANETRAASVRSLITI